MPLTLTASSLVLTDDHNGSRCFVSTSRHCAHFVPAAALGGGSLCRLGNRSSEQAPGWATVTWQVGGEAGQGAGPASPWDSVWPRSPILPGELAEGGFTSAVWLESSVWVVSDAVNLFFQDKLQGKSGRRCLWERGEETGVFWALPECWAGQMLLQIPGRVYLSVSQMLTEHLLWACHWVRNRWANQEENTAPVLTERVLETDSTQILVDWTACRVVTGAVGKLKQVGGLGGRGQECEEWEQGVYYSVSLFGKSFSKKMPFGRPWWPGG